jgi:DNA-binding transcriptional LysR family regulator
VLARAIAAESALADLGGLKRGLLSIHASQTIASYWLPSRLVAFHAAYPGVDVDVAIGNTAEVVENLLAGTAELGLVEGEVEDPALFREDIGVDRMVVVVGRSHPWVQNPPKVAQELLKSSWVLRERGSGTRSVFEAALENAGVEHDALKVSLTLPANEAVLSAVESGAGATAISASVAAAGLRGGALHQIAFDLPARSFYLLRHKQRYRSKAGDVFVSLARSMAQEIGADWAMGDGALI